MEPRYPPSPVTRTWHASAGDPAEAARQRPRDAEQRFGIERSVRDWSQDFARVTG